MLRRICRTPGSGRLRTCSNIISLLLTSAVATTTGKIDGAVIVAAIRELRLPVLGRLPVRVDSRIEAEEETAAEAKTG